MSNKSGLWNVAKAIAANKWVVTDVLSYENVCMCGRNVSNMPQPSDPLLIEANRINYRLRSTFFYHKMKEYNVLALSSLVASLFAIEHLYNWDERANWGVG